MTKEEIKMIAALSRCNFLPGSYERQFVQSIIRILAKENPKKPKSLSDEQHNYLVELFHVYRNQHLAHEVSECPVCGEIKHKMLENMAGNIIDMRKREG